MAMSDFTIVRRSLSGRLFSTVTTVVTVAVAVALMLVLLSMRDAGQRAFSRGGGNMHMLVSAESDPMGAVLNGIFYARAPRQAILWPKYEEIAKGFPLEYAIPVQQGDSFRGFPVLATTEEFFTKFTPQPGAPWKLREGRFFEKDFEVVLGAAVARSTGLGLGKKIVLTHGASDSRGGAAAGGHEHDEFKYTIVGILEPAGTAHDRGVFTNLQSAWLIHAFDRIEREHGAGEDGGHDHDHDHAHLPTVDDLIPSDRKITGIYVRVVTSRGSNVSAALPMVFDALRRDPSITVSQPKQEIDKLFGIVGNINQILVAMAGVVMVSSGIAIMLALYNSMEQRRRQVAVLRVLGASRPRIFGLVLTESAVIGALGAAAGVLLAFVGSWLVAIALKQRLGLVVDPSLTPGWILTVCAGTIILAALAGIVPAVSAYRTSVAKNLRPLG